MMYLDPFKSIANSRLFALQQILLLVLFHAAFLMSLCNDQELTYASGAHLCDRFGVGSAFCLLYTSPSPRDGLLSRMPSSA